ncbi:MAG: hypothetical protein QW161_03025 [Candidatus Bathyarchaeia archaeon]
MLVSIDGAFAVAFACLGVSQDELAETVKDFERKEVGLWLTTLESLGWE